MSEEPKIFEQTVIWRGGKSGEIVARGMPTIISGGQVQAGEIRYHTPEDLLVAAVATCFMDSSIAFIEKMRVEIKSFEVLGQGILEKVGRSFEITRVHLRAKVVIGNEEIRGKIERALELGAKYCFVGNSLKAISEYKHEIVVRSD
jgi:uncharacterized OsmC-like protein